MEYVSSSQRIHFPDPREANPWGVVAMGGNLSPGVLLSAYEQGVFPWYETAPIMWYSPDPRFVLEMDQFHLGKRLTRTIKKVLSSDQWRITMDRAFDEVIRGCRDIRRNGNVKGTWITEDIVKGYCELHNLGYTHSVEVWHREALVGGLYGVALGGYFAGESMFSAVRDASKIAFTALVGFLDTLSVTMIDCQTYTEYLASFGAEEIRREAFLTRLPELLKEDRIPRTWSGVDGREMVIRGLARAGRIGEPLQ